MSKKWFAMIVLAAASISAHSQSVGIDKLKQAFLEQQNTNSFSGYAGTCVDALLYTKGGPRVVGGARECLSFFADKNFVNSFAAEHQLTFVYRNPSMDLVLIPNGTFGVVSPKGNFFYQVNYDERGNASEITVINDSLP